MGCSSSSVGLQRTIVRTDSTILVWTMRSTGKALVRRSWRLVSRDMSAVGSNLLLELFDLNHNVRNSFPFGSLSDDQLIDDTYFRGTGLRFMQIIGTAVDNLEEIDTSLGQLLCDIGRKHILFDGFRQEYFDLFTVAVLRTWRKVLGEKCKPDVLDAWAELVGFMVAKLKEGYANQSPRYL